jgi:hypothetical protein
MFVIKYIYIYKFLVFDNFFSLFYEYLLILIYSFYFIFIKFYLFFKSFFFKIILKKHLFIVKTIYKARGYSEFFAVFFFKPTLYRFFSFYVFFIIFYISLDWTEHFFESLDNTDSEFEIDFEASFTWDNDPSFGKNFFYLGQRLALEKTSEGPDLYKINDFFFQSKKSKFSKYNREFLGGPEYLNLLDLFSEHEIFHQVGSYEFFGPAFTVIFVSYEADFEFEFFFSHRLFSFFKILIPKNLSNIFFNFDIIYVLNVFVNNFIYIYSCFFVFLKYLYKYFQKIISDLK